MKILIIKTGHSETFDLSPSLHGVVSLGDVVRTTVILNLFSDDQTSWLTSSNARELIEFAPNVQNTFTNFDDINLVDYDLVVNLERNSEILSWISKGRCKNLIGFRNEKFLITTTEKILLTDWLQQSDVIKMNWSEKLFALFSKKWNQQNYFLPTGHLVGELENKYAIGLNWKVGVKWPTKSWPKNRWRDLEAMFTDKYSVSWQEGFNDLRQYMNWINSCRIIVTHDSLGLHIAKALNKQIIALYGPTSSKETFLGLGGYVISAENAPGFSCLPCYKGECHNNIHCMDYLSIDIVAQQLRDLLGQNR